MDIDQAFAGMAKAEIFGKGTYFDEGSFVVEIATLKMKLNGHKGNSVITELRVVENLDGANAKKNPDGTLKDGPGALRSWVVKLEKKQAWGDLKAFMFAVNGTDPSKVATYEKDPGPHDEAEKLFKAAVSAEKAEELGIPPDFMIGVKLRLDTVKIMTTTTQPPHPFTVHRWSPYVEPVVEG